MRVRGERRGRSGVAREVSRHRALYLMLLLPMAFLILFQYVPMYGLQIAFKNYQPARGYAGSSWVGLKYFLKFVKGYLFTRVVGNTLSINMYSLATFPLSLLLALLLNYLPYKRYRKGIQMVSYAPYFLSNVVMAGMILQFFDARSGVINVLLGLFGVPAENYMARAECFAPIYVWTGVWQGVGYGSIIYIAALAGISAELHEAAIVDGASIVKRIRHIDIPGVLPTFCILLVLRCGSLMSLDFERILLLQNNLNGVVSEVISTYVYKQGIQADIPQYSYATAIGLFASVINLCVLTLVNLLTRRLGGASLW